MRKIREILRLKFEQGLEERAISVSCSCARSTVQEVLRRFAAAGLSWPVPSDWDDERVGELLYPAETQAAEPGEALHEL